MPTPSKIRPVALSNDYKAVFLLRCKEKFIYYCTLLSIEWSRTVAVICILYFSRAFKFKLWGGVSSKCAGYNMIRVTTISGLHS